MKRLSFGCKSDDEIYINEVLPSLMNTFGYGKGNQLKLSTIRPAFKIVEGIEEGFHAKGKPIKTHKCIVLKKPYYSEGELVNVVWKQRGFPADSWFCNKCGEIVEVVNPTGFPKIEKWKCECHKHGHTSAYFIDGPTEIAEILLNDKLKKQFPKIIGQVKIGKVFKINIQHDHSGYYAQPPHPNPVICMDKLALKDGFKSTKSFIEYFSAAYDLSTPKPFWVYADWEVIKCRD